MRNFRWLLVAAILAPSSAPAQLRELRPGFNLFTVQQDIQLGKETSVELQKQMRVVHNRDVDAYLNILLAKLERSAYARTLSRDGSRAELFPFTIHAVAEKKINAFSLPGGPIFVNTGSIEACDNEAQLAGVIAHEMSHVVLRHGTKQLTAQNLVQLPLLLAGALAGHSLLGQLTQIGIGFGANSVLLKFSRTDEEQADYNGAEIMADAGYNPLELGRFFEKLEAKSGAQGSLEQFLSDHPNPGNRVAAIQDEIRQMPRRAYVDDETGQFPHIKDIVHRLPTPAKTRENVADAEPAPSPSATVPTERPSSQFRSYRGRSFSIQYPDNWQVSGDRPANAVTIAPPAGVVEGPGGRTLVGYGLEVNYYSPAGGGAVDLNHDTQELIRHLKQTNPDTREVPFTRTIEIGGHPALLNTLHSRSPYRWESEKDALVTVARPEGLFYVVFIAPESLFDQVQPTFENVLRSVKFF
jgi:Zn-dependent protease with chaperone function